MQDRRQVVFEIAPVEPRHEFVPVEIVGDFGIGEIAEFFAIFQMVDRDDVRLASSIESAHEVRSDEAGSAGDDDVHGGNLANSGYQSSRSSAPTRVVTNGTRGATAHSNS